MKKSLKQLVIDTATRYIYLSLVIDGVEKQFVYEEGINNHSVTIIPYIEKMLKKENLILMNLDEVIVGIGPGSYTGVRIGVTVAKMIAYLNKIKIYKVSSLALLASSSNEPYVLGLIDARRGNAFMGFYKNESDKLTQIERDLLANIEEYKSKIEFEFDTVSVGVPNINKILNSDLLEAVEDVHGLTPNYLRITEAERNLRNEIKN
ncbi:MAG: tRNA (adenosine(37)-N6)-threonylcarbamoyltransferase complex dimerization subunit type 1 TsaB [Candidatus Izemoplasmatales bacterium]|jgi:tRNA threonylcarbamoyladenosine biosynthesis protein TsaB|nr:tRNA (adenosine(37)-N6)-threonylcarbamoyltransferase complex dimerization subunit type 1 TsaB [Candidatus Izemoplasmatales bacterium]